MNRLIPGILLVAIAGTASAQTAMDMANEYPPNSIHAQTADHFIRALTDVSEGAIVVTAHHGGALGYKSVDHYDAVGDGAVQIATSFSGAWSGINPIFLVSSLPFLATDLEDTRELYEATRPYYAAAMEADNQVFLYATPWPASGFWGRKPIDTVEALQGLKIRSFDTPGTTTLVNAGAGPVQLSWADIVPQLTTNGIDAVLTSADGGASAQFWEYLSDFTEVNYALPLQVTHMNRDAFEALSEEDRAALLEAARQTETFGWDLLSSRVSENYATLAQNGVTVTTEVDPALIASLQAAAEPVVSDWAERVGPDAQALLSAYRAAIAD
ncbi:TRAP transporter substrate-binding protein [Plastorhodobacter daqingensis]|uniref:TRAP transporter substrate-binding protein n=1 Tax=Plastorhodobacter daqingensis TaxID=1387281 RepID=A0ABW2UNG9_9RHOB